MEELYNAIVLLLMIFAAWVPQTQQKEPEVDLTAETTYIFKKSGESDEKYFKRILVKNYHEPLLKLDIRVQCLKVLLPDLPIWGNDNYLHYVTVDSEISHLPTYKSEYVSKIGWFEHEEQYYNRIFEKQSDETLSQYMERIGVIKTLYPNFSCWRKDDYMYYVKPYLEAYKKEAMKKRIYVPDSLSSDSSEKHKKKKKKDKKSGESKSEEFTPDNEKVDDEKILKKRKEYQKRKGEGDEEYCERIVDNIKKMTEKEFKKAIKKLGKILVADELKAIKKTCKSYVKPGVKEEE